MVVKFLRGLKPSIAKWIEHAAPDGCWTSTEQIFSKALTFESSKAAMLRSEVLADQAGKVEEGAEAKVTDTEGFTVVKREAEIEAPGQREAHQAESLINQSGSPLKNGPSARQLDGARCVAWRGARITLPPA